MSRAEKKAKAQGKRLRGQQRVMERGAKMLEAALEYAEKSNRRSDTWRNLMCASAFARGLGNERPISEVIEESFPALMRGDS